MNVASPRPLPTLVETSLAAAGEANFTLSCSEATGRLLAALAASRPDGRIGESGTGYGVGTAWLASGLGPAGRVVTVEHDSERAATARRVHSADPRVQVITGDWTELEEHGPFDVLFCDGGGKRTDPDIVISLIAPGSILVLDDFTPSPTWPPRYDGEVDTLRVRYLGHPELVAAEVLVRPEEACIIATCVGA